MRTTNYYYRLRSRGGAMDKLQLLLVLKCNDRRAGIRQKRREKTSMITDIATEDKESMEAEFGRPVKV